MEREREKGSLDAIRNDTTVVNFIVGVDEGN
jgi:hypothetical protein